MRAALTLALCLAACGGSSKPAPAPAPAENEVHEEPVRPSPEEMDPPEPESDPIGVRPLDQTSLNAGGTGSLECDELVARTICLYRATPGTPPEALKAFEDSIGAWKEALINEATRQAVFDACQMSLDAAKDGYAAAGC